MSPNPNGDLLKQDTIIIVITHVMQYLQAHGEEYTKSRQHTPVYIALTR